MIRIPWYVKLGVGSVVGVLLTIAVIQWAATSSDAHLWQMLADETRSHPLRMLFFAFILGYIIGG